MLSKRSAGYSGHVQNERKMRPPLVILLLACTDFLANRGDLHTCASIPVLPARKQAFIYLPVFARTTRGFCNRGFRPASFNAFSDERTRRSLAGKLIIGSPPRNGAGASASREMPIVYTRTLPGGATGPHCALINCHQAILSRASGDSIV